MSDYKKFQQQLLSIHLKLHEAGLQPVASFIEDALEDLEYAKEQGYVK
jgi:hypothetical protein